MRTWILKNIARIAFKYPRGMLLIALLLTVGAIHGIMQLHIDSNVLKLLPDDSAAARTFVRALQDFGAFDYMLVLIESPEPHQEDKLIEVADSFAMTINDRAYISSLDYKLDKEMIDFFQKYAEERFVFLLTESDWEEIKTRLEPENIKKELSLLKHRMIAAKGFAGRRMIEDPLNFSGIVRKRLMHSSGPTELNLRRGYFISRQGSMLMMIVKPFKPSSDVLFCRNLMDFLKRSKKAELARLGEKDKGIDIHFVGSHVEAYHDAQLIRRDLFTTGFASFVFVLVLFILAFRRLDSLIFVAIPLFVSITWTLGLTGLLFQHLTIVTFAFIAVLIGLSVDFAIHIYNRFVEELEKGRHLYPALRLAIIRTGKGIITGALTTAAAFYCLNFTSFNGFKELGTIAGNGILCGMVAIYMILPPLLVLRWRKIITREPLVSQIGSFHLDWITNRLLNYPRLVIILAMIITVYLGYFATGVKFNQNVRKLRQPNPDYLALKRKLKNHFSLPGNQVIALVSGKTIEQTLERNDLLYENIENAKDTYPILSCDSLRTFLPSRQTQLNAQRLILSLNIDRIREDLRREAAALGYAEGTFDQFFKRLEHLQSFAYHGEIMTYDSIKSPTLYRLVQRYMVDAGNAFRIVTHIYPYEGSWYFQVPREALNTFSDGVPRVHFTGVTILSSALERMAMNDLALAVILVTLSVFLITLFHFGNITRTLMAAAPIMCSMIWMLGTMAILGLELNFLNIIVVPMIIGLSIDDGIHLVGRYYELKKHNIRNAIEFTGRAVVLTSLTTMLAFGSLALGNYRGVREMGLLAIIGLGYALFSSLIVLPAILKIWGKKYRLSEFLAVEEGEIH